MRAFANCPRCRVAWALELQKWGNTVAGLYIGLTPEQCENVSEPSRPEPAANSLREVAFTCVTAVGECHIEYKCKCSECGFSHSFKHTEQLDISPKPEEE